MKFGKQLKHNEAFDVVIEELSDAEIAQLQVLSQNTILLEAVKKVLLFPIYYSGVMRKGKPVNSRVNWLLVGIKNAINDGLDRKQLGEDLVAHSLACDLIELGMEKLSSFRKEEEPKEKLNDAR